MRATEILNEKIERIEVYGEQIEVLNNPTRRALEQYIANHPICRGTVYEDCIIFWDAHIAAHSDIRDSGFYPTPLFSFICSSDSNRIKETEWRKKEIKQSGEIFYAVDGQQPHKHFDRLFK